MPAEASEHIGRIFNEAKESPDGFEAYAHQIAALLRNRSVLEDLLGALLMIAHTDGVYHDSERAYIAEVGRIFGFSPAEIRRIEQTFSARSGMPASNPYDVLGVARNATDAEVKSALSQAVAGESPRYADRPGPAGRVHRGRQQKDGGDQRGARPDQGRAGKVTRTPACIAHVALSDHGRVTISPSG